VLLGESPERAAARGRAVMSIETALARGALDIVSNRDPAKTYHIMRRAELASLAPSFAWAKYFAELNAPPFETLNVATPDSLKDMDSVIRITSLDDWKAYLVWQLVHAQAPLLPRAFDIENFDFYDRFLRGAKERLPRWRRCASLVDEDLGEALGQKYIERTFDAVGKGRTLQMVNTIEEALRKDIMSLTWMSPNTKQKAVEKLQAIANKIGYPDKWRDYSAAKMVRADAVGNSLRVNQFEFQRQLDRIGKPLDRTEWSFTPPTVNASYSASVNDITLPAGILQSPFFDKSVDDVENLGAIGVVIGHELTHGFDNRGRKFDPKGNLRDWWTGQDAGEFEKRAACMVEEYSSFKAVDDVSINGKLTLGENIADNAGLQVAYMALLENLAARTMPPIDGFTPEKRFFLAYAQVWCQNATAEVLRMDAQTNPHSTHKVRVNGAVQNMLGFQNAFSCRQGQPMVRRPACQVW
jgi:putative endopeptidase